MWHFIEALFPAYVPQDWVSKREMDLRSEFDGVADLLKQALDLGAPTHNIADIRAGVLSGKYQLWTAPHSAIVTEMVDHPRMRVCYCFLAAGDAEEIGHMRHALEEGARAAGAEMAVLIGRKGWERVLEVEGYTKAAVVLGKML